MRKQKKIKWKIKLKKKKKNKMKNKIEEKFQKNGQSVDITLYQQSQCFARSKQSGSCG